MPQEKTKKTTFKQTTLTKQKQEVLLVLLNFPKISIQSHVTKKKIRVVQFSAFLHNYNQQNSVQVELTYKTNFVTGKTISLNFTNRYIPYWNHKYAQTKKPSLFISESDPKPTYLPMFWPLHISNIVNNIPPERLTVLILYRTDNCLMKKIKRFLQDDPCEKHFLKKEWLFIEVKVYWGRIKKVQNINIAKRNFRSEIFRN